MNIRHRIASLLLAGMCSYGTVFAYNFIEITVPGLTQPSANGINNRGDIVGSGNGSSGTVGFLDSGGNFTILSFPGSTYTSASAINDAGDIVGEYKDAAGIFHGFKYSAGTWATIDAPPPHNPTFLTAINNLGQIAGSASSPPQPPTGVSYPLTFVYDSGRFSFAGLNVITGLNDSGEIVGYSDSTGSPSLPPFPVYGTWVPAARARSVQSTMQAR